MGVGINYPSDARGQMYCGAGDRIFVLQITDCPSTFMTLRADIAIKMNNTRELLTSHAFYTDRCRLATGASASSELGY
jgi:hypothetical protein